MANSYTQIYIQIVFAVSRRQGLIAPEWKADLYKYATGIIQHYRHKLLAINGMPDHIHIFIRYHPNQEISALFNDIKTSTNAFIKENRLCPYPFS
ncbi:MAG: transposase, partial [Saprospiraceae bacterium]|nr:transposase [Saprospiraceae bacterium]